MGRGKKESGMWVKTAFSKNPGALHRALKVPKGEKIPLAKIEKAEHSNKPLLRKRAYLAETARGFKV